MGLTATLSQPGYDPPGANKAQAADERQAIDGLGGAVFRHLRERIFDPLGWNELANVILVRDREARQRAADSLSTDILPALVCEAVGGAMVQALPLAAYWRLSLFAAQTFDDLQDGQVRQSVWKGFTPAQRLAAGLFALGGAQTLLAQLNVDAQVSRVLSEAFGRALALAAKAQAETVSTLATQWSVGDYFRNILLRTAQLFASVCWAGARIAQPQPEMSVLNACYHYGLALGVMKQILDDCSEMIVEEVSTDLVTGVYTLPVIHLLSETESPQRAMLQEILGDGGRLSVAQAQAVVTLVRESGSLAWCHAVAHTYRQQALAALEPLPTERIHWLVAYAYQQ